MAIVPARQAHSPDNHSRGNLIVTGDYGNWIFSQTFYPQPGAPSNVPYMLEKLKMHSTQEYSFYDRDETEKQIKERLAELNNSDNCGYKGSKLKELLEYYKECLEQVDDEIDYIERARNIPRFMDCESCMILGKVLNKQLEVVFLAFDEICKRLES